MSMRHQEEDMAPRTMRFALTREPNDLAHVYGSERAYLEQLRIVSAGPIIQPIQKLLNSSRTTTESTRTPSASSGAAVGSAAGSAMLVFSGSCAIRTPSASSGAAVGSAAGSAMLVFSGSFAISLRATFSATRAVHTTR